MKKTISLSLVILAIISCLTACNINTNSLMNSLNDKAESSPKIENMMIALTSGNASDAKALLHPQTNPDADNSINQMIEYLNGKQINSMELTNINLSSSVGTSGRVKQEHATYKIVLSNSETIGISAVYLSNNEGSGFVSFQLLLGII